MEIKEFEELQDAVIIGEEKEKFVVDTLDKANWCLKKIRKHQAHEEEIKAYVDAEKKKLDAFLKAETADDEGAITYFLEMLRPYLEAKIEGTKNRSVKAPEGLIGFKAIAPVIEMNEAEVQSFAGPDFTKTEVVTKFAWGDFKKTLAIADGHMVTADGEIVPGIKVTEKPDVIYVKLAEVK